MCVQCHLAPVTRLRSYIAACIRSHRFFYKLEHDAHRPGEIFWVIKHGIELTSMPAWDSVHSDGEIWGLVVFIGQLPDMTADEYQQVAALGRQALGGHHNGSNGQHSD